MENTNHNIIATSFEMITYVEKAQQGQTAAFEKLIHYSQNAISSIALAITKDIQASEDVTQQTYIKAWQDIGQLKNPQSFLPWIRQITRYAALNYIRSNKIEKNNQHPNYDDLLNLVCDDNDQQDLALIKQQQSQLIWNLLDLLEPDVREIVLLYYREQKNSRSVAQLLDISPSLVRKKLERARTQLKPKILNKYGNVVYSTAPAGIAAVILTVISPTSLGLSSGFSLASLKASVSTNSSVVTSLGTKVLSAFASILLPLLLALGANHLSMEQVIKRVDDLGVQRALRKLRFQTSIWMIVTAIIMAFGYGFTNGWLIPSLGFVLFWLGLYRSTLTINQLTNLNVTPTIIKIRSLEFNVNAIGCYLGLYLGLFGGGAGLVLGLLNSGRLSSLL
ncbi:RNA polymerase sigma factor [Psychrosphaera aestuarii]|uniref:RNA polymerase sigma factor n=1 Tax=Psychrosphaera aestuarii TaxID=1266052 RepID=UPI001B337B99|nr:sigma-70 family RNA polymerase sigma factor [Psychrosphaera aestuarii]